MMKKVLLIVFALAALSLVGCSVDIDQPTTIKGSQIFKSFLSATEVLIIGVDGGSLFVWSPEPALKEFLGKIQPGERIFLKAKEEAGADTVFATHSASMRFHVINEIIRLSDGSRYRRAVKY